MNDYREGQRWMSETEPELGLGCVVEVQPDRVTVRFDATGELRQYAREAAPLRRMRLRPGDPIAMRDGSTGVVSAVHEAAGRLGYMVDGRQWPETELADRLGARGPEDRLRCGHFDSAEAYALRVQAWRLQHHYRKLPVRGFLGPRIDLIPHQLYLAHEVSRRYAPRVLLADEVGLGKTIEAGLIVHRLLRSGRASRLLILVPESLVHQWFVELYRRFNLRITIFDEERCAAIERGEPGANPFLEEQTILCSLDFLLGSELRAAQARAGDWDMLVVDEAHHLEWSFEGASPAYQLVESLGAQTEGLLLLTATPEQLGPESHFARLRLLDPDRYRDYSAFLQDAASYQVVADFVESLQAERPIPETLRRRLLKRFPSEAHDLAAGLAAVDQAKPGARQELLENLLDRHGPGRVVFRNTRRAMSGFPRRQAFLVPLCAAGDHESWVDRMSTEFAVDAGDTDLMFTPDFGRDPRVEWLSGLLRELAPRKLLLICGSPVKVRALEVAMRQRTSAPCALFHEGLTLMQRDRNAAWFADEDGARMLLCSEIGSEGRNFQFAHHLVLFDLPLNPELLEQRIGRLDRIGQTQNVCIHVPYLAGSPQGILAHWYHEGLNAFEHPLEGGNELYRQFRHELHDLALEFPLLPPADGQRQLEDLIDRSRRARQLLRRQLEQGRDRLLELNSHRPRVAQCLIEDIRREDRHPYLEDFLLQAFDHFGVRVEELASRTYRLDATGLLTEAFPAIPQEGLTVTLDRSRAVHREELSFLSWDHPMVAGIFDLVLGSETGSCCFAIWPFEGKPSLLLEAWFILEAVADPQLHADRFLPATPLRAVVDHLGHDLTETHPKALLDRMVQRAGSQRRSLPAASLTERSPGLLQAAANAIEARVRHTIELSRQAMHRMLDHEIARIEHLLAVQAHVRPRELELARRERLRLEEILVQSRPRLGGVRLVWKGPQNG
jgi:ATP-dependent helicase HepA